MTRMMIMIMTASGLLKTPIDKPDLVPGGVFVFPVFARMTRSGKVRIATLEVT